MRFSMLIWCTLAVSLLFAGAALAATDGTAWCGDPDAVQSKDNPYVKLAEHNVTRALMHPDAFWLVWGYAAPESARRGDAKLRERAVAEMAALVKRLEDKPSGYWDVLPALEAIRILKRYPDFSTALADEWLAKLKPSVQANYDTNAKEEEWMTVAPNALHQSAAILQLASQLYNEPRYTEMAHKLIRVTATYQEPDGAFRYIRNSGPVQVYYGFDSTFLGRYYQLSRDPLAKEMLVKLANYSRDVLANGLIESSSTPWWKHHWSTGGPLHGVEIVAGVSRDPLTRAVAEYRLAGGQPYYFAYYAMYCWDPTISKATLAPDLCRYNTNIAGPQIRVGSLQAVMPGKAYADTGIGCTVVTGKKPFAYDGYLETAALPVLGKGVTDPYHRPDSLITASPEELNTRASLVGPGWIASGWTFQPRQPFFGDATPPAARGWRLAQLWFADANGLGGWITATCQAKSPVLAGPRGYLSLGHPIETMDKTPDCFTSGELAVRVTGEGITRQSPVGKNVNACWLDFATAGEREYQAGEHFGYGLSIAPRGAQPHEVQALPAEGILAVRLTRANGVVATVLFNPQAIAVKTNTAPVGQLWRVLGDKTTTQPKAWSGNVLTLQPYELVVILPKDAPNK